MPNDPIGVALKATKVFEELGVPYLIAGSPASTLHGKVRTTQDSDVISEMRAEHIGKFTAALEDEFFIDEQQVAESIARHFSFHIIHREMCLYQ